MTIIYHLARQHAWEAAQTSGIYEGTPEDRVDGFVHFSTAAQVAESAARHRAGETDLVLIAADSDVLGEAVQWEVSRGGARFPHLYGNLPVSAVRSATPLPLGKDGLHVFPELD